MALRRRVALGVLIAIPLLAAVLSADSKPGKDGIWHFSYLHSIVFDRDLDLANEYEAIYPTWAARPWFVEETDRPPNVSPIGAALFWLPAYLIVVVTRIDPTGLGFASRASTVIVSSGMVSIAVFLAHDLAKRLETESTLAVATVAVGSFFSYWWLFPGQMSHGVAIGISTLYVWYWFTRLDRQNAGCWLLLGLLGGLVAIVRWQNVLLPLLSLPWKVSRATSPKSAAVGLSLYSFAFVLAFAPQMFAWHSIYGQWLLTPQGEFMHWTKPYLVDVLFSPRYGLLGFSPILYISVIGLALSFSSFMKPLVGLSISYFLVSIYVNGSAGDWYAGATFGPRRMDSLFVALVIGASLFIPRFTNVIRRKPQVVATTLTIVSLAATLILGRAYRSSEINVGMVGAHEFPYRAAESLIRTVGWLPSLPAEMFYALRDGTRIGQYSALAHDDPLTWLDGVIVPDERRLSSEWELDGLKARLEGESGTVFLYLMDLGFHYYDIELDLDFSGSLSRPIEINAQPFQGSLKRANGQWRYSVIVPYDAWRPGMNRMTVAGREVVLTQIVLRYPTVPGTT